MRLRPAPLLALASLATLACAPAVVHARSYRCERNAGCTVVVNGASAYYGPGVIVPVACAPGIVVVGGCGCGPLPAGVVVACGCSGAAVPSCGCGTGAPSCGTSCGSCGSCGSG